jgi:hypothetical protein
MSLARPAPVEGLDVKEAGDGLLIYQTVTRVHRLNPTASVVFELCDGTRTSDGVIELVGRLWDMDEPPRDAVLACLDDLRSRGVVQ